MPGYYSFWPTESRSQSLKCYLQHSSSQRRYPPEPLHCLHYALRHIFHLIKSVGHPQGDPAGAVAFLGFEAQGHEHVAWL